MARGAVSVILTGDKALDRKLKRFERKTANKMARAAIRAGQTPILKAARAEISASGAPRAVKRAAKRTLGRSLRKSRGHITAKVGFGVGKRKKARQGTSGGVGLGVANVNWFVLGTKERTRGSGGATGKIEPLLFDVMPRAAAKSKSASFAAQANKMREVLKREARRP